VVVPEAGLVVAITSANFGFRGAHDMTDHLLVDFVLASLED
jgi:hypothetical protein